MQLSDYTDFTTTVAAMIAANDAAADRPRS